MASTSPAERPTRSLKHEYGLFVEMEIENYKESVQRSVLMSIGDEAVAALSAAPQFALTELVLCEEVDRIIFKRLRLPTYTTWRRRHLKLIDELRRPEHWGLRPDDLLLRALASSGEGRVLVAGGTRADESSALFLAANGCDVTTLTDEEDVLQRVMDAARGAGLSGRVHTEFGDLSTWMPESPLTAVIVNPEVLGVLTAAERARVIEVLQSATTDGGVHLVQTIAASKSGASLSLEELKSRYRGWEVTVERGDGTRTFLARKGAA
jgi:hypothetical protein